MKILVLNSGSSSQKTCLYEIEGALPEHPPAPIWEGRIEWGAGRTELRVRNLLGQVTEELAEEGSHLRATERLLDMLCSGTAQVSYQGAEIGVVGHRVVNGGPAYIEPTLILPEVKAAIEQTATLAPLHNRIELDGIALIEKRFGKIPQVAVFDTAFHSRLPEAAAIYAGPYEWIAHGIHRYGFHGINHQYWSERAAQLLKRELDSLRIVTCHLGNGCSLAAVQNGRCIDTTMGFTPLEGLVMGTRSGSVDPGILTFLIRQGHLTADELDDVLYNKSGLLGISGISSDMRQIVAARRQNHPRAILAFDIFVHRLRACIGAMIGSLGGIDALVYTAGIGENSPEVRSVACDGFSFLGMRLDAEKNALPRPDEEISASDSAVPVLIVRAQEEWAIAKECWKLATAISSAHQIPI